MSLTDFLKQPEGRRLEFKQQISRKSDLKKTRIAFANDAGGLLFIGIKDSPREIVGLPEKDIMQREEKISSLIFDSCITIFLQLTTTYKF